MAFKKEMKSKDVVVLSSGNYETMFPVGFEYVMGGTIYKVSQCYKDGPTHMRKLIRSDGGEEILTVEQMIKDMETSNVTNRGKTEEEKSD